MNPLNGDKILLLLGSKSMTPSRSMTLSPSQSPTQSLIPIVQGSQGSNLLIVIAVPISLFAAFLLAVVVIQAIYYNRRRVHRLTEVPLPAISMSPILTSQTQEFNISDPCNLEDPAVTTENPMHKNVAI